MQFMLHRINLFRKPFARPDVRAARISATIAIATVIGTLTGCGNESAGGRYPPDWPKLERVATNGKNCPDITGNYTFENDVDDSAFGSDSTFIGRNVTRDAKWPWQSVALSGDASVSLTLTYSRPRPALSGVRCRQTLRKQRWCTVRTTRVTTAGSSRQKQICRFVR